MILIISLIVISWKCPPLFTNKIIIIINERNGLFVCLFSWIVWEIKEIDVIFDLKEF